jgi:hypothetical protein
VASVCQAIQQRRRHAFALVSSCTQNQPRSCA